MNYDKNYYSQADETDTDSTNSTDDKNWAVWVNQSFDWLGQGVDIWQNIKAPKTGGGGTDGSGTRPPGGAGTGLPTTGMPSWVWIVLALVIVIIAVLAFRKK